MCGIVAARLLPWAMQCTLITMLCAQSSPALPKQTQSDCHAVHLSNTSPQSLWSDRGVGPRSSAPIAHCRISLQRFAGHPANTWRRLRLQARVFKQAGCRFACAVVAGNHCDHAAGLSMRNCHRRPPPPPASPLQRQLLTARPSYRLVVTQRTTFSSRQTSYRPSMPSTAKGLPLP